MAQAEAAEATDEEVEAALAVYGSDCTVIQRSPPHLLVRLKPRTADDISQQVRFSFVVSSSDHFMLRTWDFVCVSSGMLVLHSIISCCKVVNFLDISF